MNQENRYTCLHCSKVFPKWYWGVSGHAGGYGDVRKPGLAKANFKRHKQACKKNAQKIRLVKTDDNKSNSKYNWFQKPNGN